MSNEESESYKCGNCGRSVGYDEGVNNGYCPECTEEYDK